MEGRREGLTEGRREGLREGRAELLIQMLRSGKTPEEIASFTGTPLSEMEAIEESLSVGV